MLLGAAMAVFSGAVNAQDGAAVFSPVSLSLPEGATIQSASAEQLASAVAAAVAKNPDRAAEIVASVIGQLGDRDGAKASAIISAVISLPAIQQDGDKISALVHAAVVAKPAFAVEIAVAAATVAPTLAAPIAHAAVVAAPDQAEAITQAVAAVPGVDTVAVAAAVQDALTETIVIDRGPAQNPNPGSNSINPANLSGGEISES